MGNSQNHALFDGISGMDVTSLSGINFMTKFLNYSKNKFLMLQLESSKNDISKKLLFILYSSVSTRRKSVLKNTKAPEY